MKYLYKNIIFILLFSSGCATQERLSSQRAPIIPCIDYSKKTLKVHPGHHFYDEDIHLSPVYGKNGSKQKGYLVLNVKPGSIYAHLGLNSADVITHVNGTAIDKKISISGKHLTKIKKIKDISVQIERCQKIKLSKDKR